MTPRESLSLALDEAQGGGARLALGAQAVVLRGFARDRAPELIKSIAEIAAVSPFRHMVTPGGWEMSVALTEHDAGSRAECLKEPRRDQYFYGTSKKRQNAHGRKQRHAENQHWAATQPIRNRPVNNDTGSGSAGRRCAH